MSVQFGRWDFDGQSPRAEYFDKVGALLAPYGPDSNEVYANGGMTILYRAFHTTKESHREIQPYVSSSGAVITWDGRLDNRAELTSELRALLKTNAASEFTDVEIVAGAFEKWGVQCLARLIGDWAVAIWNPRDRMLILAKDPLGAIHLYYSMEKDQVTWSTILDPLVLCAGRTFPICEEYVAGWLSHLPAPHVTPYTDIYAVPPSSSVLLRQGKHGVRRVVTKYWDFDPDKRIRYRTDDEYEDHFRTVFLKAVQRRLRSDRPVLAELSGGMDSSSIVCVADLLIASGKAECPRLDTISWSDSTNPNWDDPVYFAKVEEKRGCIGFHIDVSSLRKDASLEESLVPKFNKNRFAATAVPRELPEQFKQYAKYVMSQGHRVTISGIGGEDPTGGGIPTPTPELQNLLATGRLFTMARQLKAWAARMRKPRLPLLREALRGFLPLAIVGLPEYIRPTAPWFSRTFVRRNRAPLQAYSSRIKFFGPLPSFQDHLHMLDCERRVMAHCFLHPELLREIRYPFHDRDLREFAYSIPWEQVVRVGQRRSLMRRALVGIVPDVLLNRKQKPFFPELNRKVAAQWPSSVGVGWQMVSSLVGIVDPHQFWMALQKAERGDETHLENLKRTLTLESWLRHLISVGVLENSLDTKRQAQIPFLADNEFQPPSRPQSLAS